MPSKILLINIYLQKNCQNWKEFLHQPNALKWCAAPKWCAARAALPQRLRRRRGLCYTRGSDERFGTGNVIDPKKLDELQARLREVFAHSPAQDLERNLKAALIGLFARLELVTREEFDIQREVLLRTREKLDRLERKLAELEGGGSGAATGTEREQPSQPD